MPQGGGKCSYPCPFPLGPWSFQDEAEAAGAQGRGGSGSSGSSSSEQSSEAEAQSEVEALQAAHEECSARTHSVLVSDSLPGRASARCTFTEDGPRPCWSSRQVSLRHVGSFASRVTSKTHRLPPSPTPSDCSAFSPGAGGVDGEPRPLRAAPRAPSQHPLGGQPLPLCGIRRLAREVRGQPAGTVFGQADRRCGAGTQMLHALRVLAGPRQVRARGAAATGL
jgi:hypothetical protein